MVIYPPHTFDSYTLEFVGMVTVNVATESFESKFTETLGVTSTLVVAFTSSLKENAKQLQDRTNKMLITAAIITVMCFLFMIISPIGFRPAINSNCCKYILYYFWGFCQ